MASSAGYWDRFARARVTRRRALASGAALAAGAAAFAAIGCNDDKGPSAGSEPTPTSGGTLRTGTTLPLAAGLDPHIEQATGLTIFPRVYGYLLHVDPRDDSVIYDHAESVEQPDPVTYIIKLRPNVRFQDEPPVNGRVVTSEDVAASFARYRGNQLVPSKTWHTTVLDRIEAPDATTVRIVTKRPYVYSLQEIGGINAGAIIPKEAMDAQQNLSMQGAGSGPFRIESASLANGARIVGNRSYYRTPIPYLDAMEWKVFGTDDDKAEAFRRHDVDVVVNDDRVEAESLRDFSARIQVTATPSLAYLSIGMRSDRGPLEDPRVRGAVDIAIDRDALIRNIGLGDGTVLGPVNPHLADGFWSLPQADVIEAHHGGVSIEERRTAAQAILVASGAANLAFTLQVAAVPQLIDLATVVREQLQRVGFVITLQEMDLLAWYNNLRRGDFDATLISHQPYEWPDAPTRFYHSLGPEASANPFGYADGTLDGLIERSWGETDREQRRATLRQAQKMMIYGRPMVQLYTGVGYSSAWDHVRNHRPELPGSLAQYNYEQWLAPDEA